MAPVWGWHANSQSSPYLITGPRAEETWPWLESSAPNAKVIIHPPRIKEHHGKGGIMQELRPGKVGRWRMASRNHTVVAFMKTLPPWSLHKSVYDWTYQWYFILDRGVAHKALLAVDFLGVGFPSVVIDTLSLIEQRPSYPYLCKKLLNLVSHTQKEDENKGGELLRRRKLV